MEGMLRGPRRARRLAQNSALSSGGQGSSPQEQQELSAARRFLMNYYGGQHSPHSAHPLRGSIPTALDMPVQANPRRGRATSRRSSSGASSPSSPGSSGFWRVRKRASRPIPRKPLQNLEISAARNLTQARQKTMRPFPMINDRDAENMDAFQMARDARQMVYQLQLAEMDRRIAMRERGQEAGSDDSEDEEDFFPDGGEQDHLDEMEIPQDMPDEEAHEDYEAEDTSAEEAEDHVAEQGDEQHEEEEPAAVFDPGAAGLKEISNLGKFTVSSHKQTCGVEELRSDDLMAYWQSDGPQPHKLTVYFVKRVGIREIRFYVDYNKDESYTPTKIVFKSGTSENNLIDFAVMDLTAPVGWQTVPIAGSGGGPDGNTLVSYVFQMQILENHQNGKDTHLRSIKIYAADTDNANNPPESNPVEEMVELIDDVVDRMADQVLQEDPETRADRLARRLREGRWDPGEGGLGVPDFMREPEIR